MATLKQALQFQISKISMQIYDIKHINNHICPDNDQWDKYQNLKGLVSRYLTALSILKIVPSRKKCDVRKVLNSKYTGCHPLFRHVRIPKNNTRYSMKCIAHSHVITALNDLNDLEKDSQTDQIEIDLWIEKKMNDMKSIHSDKVVNI